MRELVRPGLTSSRWIERLHIADVPLLRGFRSSGPIGHAFLELLRSGCERAADLHDRCVEQVRLLAVGGMRPLLRPRRAGTDLLPLRRRSQSDRDLSCRWIDITPRHPGPESRSANELTVRSIEDEQVAIAIELGEQPAPVLIEEDLLIDAVVVPDIMWRRLVVPLQHAVIGAESNDGIGVQIVAAAHVAVEVRARVAGAPIDEIQRRIIGTGNPGRAPTPLPGIAGPRFASLLAWFGHVVAPPDAPSCTDVERIDVAADTVLAARRANEHHVLHDEWRHRRALTGADVHERHIPHGGPANPIERHNVTVLGGEDHFALRDRHTTIHVSTTERNVERNRMTISPQLLS